MKNFFKILVVLIIFTSSINAQEGHEGHDHGPHGGEGFYGHLDLNIFADKITSVSSDGKYEELYLYSHAELGFGFGKGLLSTMSALGSRLAMVITITLVY